MQDLSSLSRGLSLLDAFVPDCPELSIRELAERAGIPRSTTHRLVQSLVQWGALERGERGLRLGVKLFELGTMVPIHTTIREAASPFLHTLNEVSRLTANLAIRDGNQIVYLEKISVASLRVPHTRLGGRAGIHCTALGKAILAFSPNGVVAEVVAAGLAASTGRTIVDGVALQAELSRIRRHALAYDVEESQEGLFCVAAPILDTKGRALAAVSVTGAVALAQAERLGPAVQATARSIARRFSAGTRRA